MYILRIGGVSSFYLIVLLFFLVQVRWEDYGRGIHAVLAGQGTGVDVDFSTHKLVAIGHSIGSAAVYVSI
jgi:hypothetical protein